MSYKFGKLPPITDTRTLKMTKYAIKFPPTPPAVDYLTKVPSYPMYSNDTLGDCVAAAAGHMIESWTEYAGKFYEPTDADIIAKLATDAKSGEDVFAAYLAQNGLSA